MHTCFYRRPFSLAAAAALSLAVAACGGGSSSSGAPSGGSIPSNPQTTTITILVPDSTTTQSQGRRTASTSPATESVGISIESSGGTQAYDATTDVTQGSSGCTTTSTATTCTIQITLQAGSYVADIETFSGENGSGTVLSQGQVYVFMVANGATRIGFTLGGTPNSIGIVPIPGAPSLTSTQGSQSAGYTLYSESNQPFAATAYDANGNAIIGDGAPSFTGGTSNTNFSVTQPTTNAPNSVGLAPPASNVPSTTSFSVQASFSDPTICTQSPAVCSGATTVNYLNIAGDDWLTYAHDFMRTGDESLSTGISTSTAQNLALRWKVNVRSTLGMYASPVVYDGNVIVVTYYPPAYVYDLSAIDGHIIWFHKLEAGAIQTPTIDPVAGLVFVGDRLANGANSEPSNEYALNLKSGNVVWQATVDGLTRSDPVVANGNVYLGTAGGDPPGCLNGGVEALNELTGATEWVWDVNAATNPGGGGSVWGAIAFDGTRLIFGTGNTCQTPVTTANGAAALDLNGNLLWSTVAQPDSYLDYDTGSSVLISNGDATFYNKNGIMYTVDAATGNTVRQTTVDSNYGYGEFSSPASDGVTTVIGGGLYPTPAPDDRAATATRAAPQVCMLSNTSRAADPFQVVAGYTSNVTGVNSSGTIIWQHPTTAMLDGYPAINNGVVFADLDSSIGALNITNGNVLWSYALDAMPLASPAVVPSGVYIADGDGNVYAFSLPYSTGSTPSAVRRAKAIRHAI